MQPLNHFQVWFVFRVHRRFFGPARRQLFLRVPPHRRRRRAGGPAALPATGAGGSAARARGATRATGRAATQRTRCTPSSGAERGSVRGEGAGARGTSRPALERAGERAGTRFDCRRAAIERAAEEMRAARLGGGRRCGANAARRSAPRAGARAAPTPPKHSRAAATVQPRWYDLNAAYKERTNYDKAAPPPHPPSAVIARGGGSEPIDGVFFLGHRSKGTFGAAGYLLLREGGNVLVDCARPDERLVDAVRALGGAKWHLMSHTDDVAGHHEWHGTHWHSRSPLRSALARVRTGSRPDWHADTSVPTTFLFANSTGYALR